MTTNEGTKLRATRIDEIASAGLVVPVDPDDADDMGAFVDEAVPPDVALDSRFDDLGE